MWRPCQAPALRVGPKFALLFLGLQYGGKRPKFWAWYADDNEVHLATRRVRIAVATVEHFNSTLVQVAVSLSQLSAVKQITPVVLRLTVLSTVVLRASTGTVASKNLHDYSF